MYFPRNQHFLCLNNGNVSPSRQITNELRGVVIILADKQRVSQQQMPQNLHTPGHLGQRWQTVENTELPSVVVINAKPEPPLYIFFHSLGPISGFRLSVGDNRALSHQPVDEGPAGVVCSFTHLSPILACFVQAVTRWRCLIIHMARHIRY